MTVVVIVTAVVVFVSFMRVLYQKRREGQGSETDFHNFFRDFPGGRDESDKQCHGQEAEKNSPVIHCRYSERSGAPWRRE